LGSSRERPASASRSCAHAAVGDGEAVRVGEGDEVVAVELVEESAGVGHGADERARALGPREKGERGEGA
jgi:hypothetical protein